jgi:hypothetical protein
MNTAKLKESDAFGVSIMLVSSLSIAFLPNSAKLALDHQTTVMALLVGRLLIGL